MHRSREYKILGGVCGGIAESLGWSPTVVRILFVVTMIVIPGSQLIIYPILWLILPKRPLPQYPQHSPYGYKS
ncbi:PspC domain-containing protein [Thermopolyspora sp. NPDC052614]|uniref:PspC domain-containing protein n=1 Tax=Thermopolyspora sp. NPDC052614 TaxID=3155682 RepID=UPI00343081D9